jgi:cell division protein ZapE
MTQELLAALQAHRRAGALQADPAQDRAAAKLQALHDNLVGYRGGRTGWLARLGLARAPAPPPRGLYIHGPVGRGKSMLMDLFFDRAPVEHKRRVHFHAFMQEIHDRAHGLREDGMTGDPISLLAGEVADRAGLLCFDEFHVDNIADAMILGRLFEALFARGVVIVATSNQAPDELYKDGLQRELFLPFIELIKQRLGVLSLHGAVDYRLSRLKGMRVYHVPADATAAAALETAFRDLANGAPDIAAEIVIKGRTLTVPRSANGVAYFSFAELCERPLGAPHALRAQGQPYLLCRRGSRRASCARCRRRGIQAHRFTLDRDAGRGLHGVAAPDLNVRSRRRLGTGWSCREFCNPYRRSSSGPCSCCLATAC